MLRQLNETEVKVELVDVVWRCSWLIPITSVCAKFQLTNSYSLSLAILRLFVFCTIFCNGWLTWFVAKGVFCILWCLLVILRGCRTACNSRHLWEILKCIWKKWSAKVISLLCLLVILRGCGTACNSSTYCVLLILFFIADKWYSKEVNVFPVSVHLPPNKKIENQERIVVTVLGRPKRKRIQGGIEVDDNLLAFQLYLYPIGGETIFLFEEILLLIKLDTNCAAHTPKSKVPN